MAYLILVRHGESEWNKKGIWTGLRDIGLSKQGIKESRLAGEKLKGARIDIAYTSPLKRAKQTLEEIKKVLGINNLLTIENKALNERDYGEFTGRNKWEIKKEVGDEKFLKIRRDWNYQIPSGETLKDVYNRMVPYYKDEILPKLKGGKNVLIVAHGNSLRALVKYLENIPDSEIENLEIETGKGCLYKIDSAGNIASKQILL